MRVIGCNSDTWIRFGVVEMKLLIFIILAIISVQIIVIVKSIEDRNNRFELGKRFVRDSLLQSVDKMLLGNYNLIKTYDGIPDSVLNRQISELKDSASYKLVGKGLK